MVEEEIDTVEGFKSHTKQLLKDSKLKEAIGFVTAKFEAASFEKLQLRESVTLVHWWVKAYSSGSDLRSLSSKCLTRVNTMINTVQTSPLTTFKNADNTTGLTQLEVDQCLAELLYLKRVIETQIMLVDEEKSL